MWAVHNYGHFQKFPTIDRFVWYTSGWRSLLWPIPNRFRVPRLTFAVERLTATGARRLSSLSDGNLDQFREHCIERHGLHPNDTERICWFDLEALTMTLLED